MITFAGTGTLVTTGSGDLTFLPPATRPDDILVVAITSRDNVPFTQPIDWIPILPNVHNGTGLSSNTFYKRVVDPEAPFTFGRLGGGLAIGNVVAFRGLRSGAGVNVVDTSTAGYNGLPGTACLGPTVQAAAPGELLVFTAHTTEGMVMPAAVNTFIPLSVAFSHAFKVKKTGASVGLWFGVLPDLSSGVSQVAISPALNIGSSTIFFPA